MSGGRIAALVARGCIGKNKEEWNLDLALNLLQKENKQLQSSDLEKAKFIAERVLKEVVTKKDTPEALEEWAGSVEDKEEPFADADAEMAEANEVNGLPESSVATKAQLQAAVKTLNMGPSAYKGLPKDDAAAYCKGLQRRILDFILNLSGQKRETLPSPEELMEIKKAVEAEKELLSLDASNIIQGRPKRRAASSAAEAIKRDIARDLEREAAQAASEPQQKKPKNEKADIAAAAASSSSKPSEADDKREKKEEEEEEEDSDDDEEGSSEESDNSSGSGSSDDDDDDDDEEEEEEDEDEE